MFYTIVRPLDEPLLAGPDLRMLSDDEYRTQSNVGRTLNAEEYQRLDRKYSLEPAGTDKTLKQAPTKQVQQNAEMRLSDSMKSGLKRRGRSSRQ
jgi:cell filamentation protein